MWTYMEKSECRSSAKHKQYIKWPLNISVRTNGTQEFFSDAFFVTTQNCKKSFAAMILDVRLPNDIDVKISMPISVYFFFYFQCDTPLWSLAEGGTVQSGSCFHNLLNVLERVMCARINQ